MAAALPRAALVWVWMITLLGAITAYLGALKFRSLDTSDCFVMLGFGVVVLLSDLRGIRLAPFNVEITLSIGILFGASLIFGRAAIPLALGSLLADAWARRHLSRAIFNASLASLAIWCSARVWEELRPPPTVPPVSLLSSPGTAPAWLAAGAVYMLVNVGAVITVVSLADRSKFRSVLRNSLGGIIVQLLTLPTLGVLIADLYNKKNPFALLLVALPLVAVHYSLRNVYLIRRQTLATIERLSDIVDRRDPATERHSQRVAELTGRICREMGLPADVTARTVSAARVHDLGKVGMPDSVLFKPEQLSPEEWEIVKRHPEAAAEILAPMESYSSSTIIIRHHHEHWDGQGYPDAISGEDIPLGARILTVADTYDVMTTGRPYRPSLDRQTIMDELRLQAGRQFDPAVVGAFLRAMGEAPSGERNGAVSPPSVSHHS